MLIKCPECELQVSDKAIACPHCGYPLKSNANSRKSRNKNNKRSLHSKEGTYSFYMGLNTI